MSKTTLCHICDTVRVHKNRSTAIKTDMHDKNGGDVQRLYICPTCAGEILRDRSKVAMLEQKRQEHEARLARGKAYLANKDKLQRRKDRKRQGIGHKIKARRWRASHVRFQGGKCVLCDREFSDALPPPLDHIVPLSKGGDHSYENTQALCEACHIAKDS